MWAAQPVKLDEEKYNGYVNSATYCTCLYLQQEASVYQQIWNFVGADRQVCPKKLSAKFRVKRVREDSEQPEGLRGNVVWIPAWTSGEVDWAEIASSYSELLGDPPHSGQTLSQEPQPQSADLSLIELFAEALIDGNVVRFPRKLNRNDYQRVDAALTALGGAWDRKASGHVFAHDPTDLVEGIIETGTYDRPERVENFGFFPTPNELVEVLIREARLEPGMVVLEPSAGVGNIAVQAAAIVGTANVITVELQEKNVEVLKGLGFCPVHSDFLAFRPERTPAAIVMNPPFSRQADIDHVLHAWSMLKEGGRLVAIMAASVTFRSNAKSAAFRDLVAAHGRMWDNPEGSFKSVGTMVRTITVVLQK
ncbi:methyltransferase [Noviherbaspirillum pedocola]|uniref:Methyltransferase n=1 Tax=Noviherbaspirillum pedocola TaxID=2801341 RepID=A0A934W8T1_9BURK|nr:methyltransferase [Noviherbaspirillum pedocola]MBK4737950.1 methyltransferase [Noviherbaspirillum pedocola]